MKSPKLITTAITSLILFSQSFAQKQLPLPGLTKPIKVVEKQPTKTKVVQTKAAQYSEADTKVCLKLSQQSFKTQTLEDKIESKTELIQFFKRYMEYTISHETGYISVKQNCDEVLTIELYAIPEGWSVFARYTGTAQEESVDKLKLDEIQSFSERIVQALFYKKEFQNTIDRYNVISSDSHKQLKKMKGERQAFFAVGVSPRVLKAGKDYNNRSIQFSNPFVVRLGSKYSYAHWTMQLHGHAGFNPNKSSLLATNTEGEARFAGEGGLGVQFLYTPQIKSLTGSYLGTGGTMKLQSYTVYGQTQDQSLFGGGLDLDLISGWEFFRGTQREAFIQLELNLPTYLVQSRKANGFIDSWAPSMTALLGMNF